MNRHAVVVDASVAVSWVFPEPYSETALRVVSEWIEAGVRRLAPGVFAAEVTNALYKRVARGETDPKTARTGLQVLLAFSIELLEEPGLATDAMDLAHRYGRPTTYDCYYLALAERYDCELWTADRRFFNALTPDVSRVRWIGETEMD